MSATAYVLLPALTRFAALDDFRRRLARADALPTGARDELAAGECFHWGGGALPVAALVREYVAHDAGAHTWLCVDLAHVEPDMTGVRMLACGSLDVSAREAEALAKPLRPVFGDHGMLLEVTLPTHWHLRLPPSTPMPALDPPCKVLGDDLIDHLPAGAAGRQWRQLLNEAQVILHQHRINAERARQGQPTVNSVWLWGAGVLPAHVTADVAQVYGDDVLLTALAARAGVTVQPLANLDAVATVDADTLLDLGQRDAREACALALELLELRRVRTLVLHFASGERYHVRRSQRWRFWRRGP